MRDAQLPDKCIGELPMLRRTATIACLLFFLVESFGQALVHLSFDDPQNLGKDNSGRGHHGSVQGTPGSSNSGRAGGAIAFDGNGGIELGGRAANALDGDFTISLWVRTTQNTGGPNDLAVGVLHAVGNDDSRTMPVGLGGGRAGSGLDQAELHSQSQINHGDWVNVVITRDKGKGESSLFVNGHREAHHQGFGNAARVHELLVLGLNPGHGLHFAGELDDFQLYDRAIPASDVAFLHANPGSALFTAVPEPSTVALFSGGLLVIFSLTWRQRRRSAVAARHSVARMPARHACRQVSAPSHGRCEQSHAPAPP